MQNEIKLKNKDVGELKAKIEELEDMVTKYKEAYNPSKILDYEDMVVNSMKILNRESYNKIKNNKIVYVPN